MKSKNDRKGGKASKKGSKVASSYSKLHFSPVVASSKKSKRKRQKDTQSSIPSSSFGGDVDDDGSWANSKNDDAYKLDSVLNEISTPQDEKKQENKNKKQRISGGEGGDSLFENNNNDQSKMKDEINEGSERENWLAAKANQSFQSSSNIRKKKKNLKQNQHTSSSSNRHHHPNHHPNQNLVPTNLLNHMTKNKRKKNNNLSSSNSNSNVKNGMITPRKPQSSPLKTIQNSPDLSLKKGDILQSNQKQEQQNNQKKISTTAPSPGDGKDKVSTGSWRNKVQKRYGKHQSSTSHGLDWSKRNNDDIGDRSRRSSSTSPTTANLNRNYFRENFPSNNNTSWRPNNTRASSVVEQQKLLDRYSSSVLRGGLRNVGNTCYFNSILQCFSLVIGYDENLREACFGRENEEEEETSFKTKFLFKTKEEENNFEDFSSRYGLSQGSSSSSSSLLTTNNNQTLQDEDNFEGQMLEVSILRILFQLIKMRRANYDLSLIKKGKSSLNELDKKEREKEISILPYAIKPFPILRSISKLYPLYGKGRQQDAHELLIHLLGGIELNRLDEKEEEEINHNNGDDEEEKKEMSEDCDQETENNQHHQDLPSDSSSFQPILPSLFKVKIVKTITCSCCGDRRKRFEDQFGIPLTFDPKPPTSSQSQTQSPFITPSKITNNQRYSLPTLLSYFFQEEECELECEKCFESLSESEITINPKNGKPIIPKKLTTFSYSISTLPPVLLLNLKRFTIHPITFQPIKLSHKTSIPHKISVMKYLDSDVEIEEEEKKEKMEEEEDQSPSSTNQKCGENSGVGKYKLVAILNHLGINLVTGFGRFCLFSFELLCLFFFFYV